MRVTLDSNVWQMVAEPALARSTSLLEACQAAHDALRSKRIKGFICETVGTLEAIQRQSREAYFHSLRPSVDVKSDIRDGQIFMAINIDTNHAQHPGLPKVLDERLEVALKLGMRLMRAVRTNIGSHFFLCLILVCRRRPLTHCGRPRQSLGGNRL
jgi:hypothetical protein